MATKTKLLAGVALMTMIGSAHAGRGRGADLQARELAGEAALEECLDDEARLTMVDARGPAGKRLVSRGPAVAKVKDVLRRLTRRDGSRYQLGERGVPGPEYDLYDHAMWEAIKAFKRDHQLGAYEHGDVGPLTMRTLDELARRSEPRPPVPPTPPPQPAPSPSPAPAPTPPSGRRTDADGNRLVINGFWNGSHRLPVARAGMTMHFRVTAALVPHLVQLELSSTGVCKQAQKMLLVPGHTVDVTFDCFGREPMPWVFEISTNAGVNFELFSSWVPGDPPNP